MRNLIGSQKVYAQRNLVGHVDTCDLVFGLRPRVSDSGDGRGGRGAEGGGDRYE